MSNPSSTSRTAIIIGGGLAGIAAAVKLADRGAAVTLIETRKRLGGRATSFVDPTTGQVLDNCQHVLMGCCTNLLDLYKRLGVEKSIEWHRTLYFMNLGDRDGPPELDGESSRPIDVLEADDLPAPLHMTRALMGFKQLSLLEKLAISRGMLAMMRMGSEGRSAWHASSFAEWLEALGQPRGAIEKFWEPVVISALNETPDNCAADYAIHVYQDGFLSSSDAYVMGLSKVPLVQLYDAAESVITKAGGRVMLGTSADQFHFENDRITALQLGNGSLIHGDTYISALTSDRLAKICSPEMYRIDPRLRRLDRFTTSPIIGIHLWFACAANKPVMSLPHLTLTQSPLQWIFSKGIEDHEGTCAQHLHCVISAAHDLVDLPADAITQRILEEVRKALPLTRHNMPLHARVVKEKRATFSPRPGVEVNRPAAAGPIANLLLAGDFCKTGWPATMEGAVRSGYLAAAEMMRGNFDGVSSSPSLVPDLPAEAMYRVIGW